MKAVINVQGIMHKIKNPMPFGDGGSIIEFVVKIDESYRNRNGDFVEKFNFLQMAAFNKLAKEISYINVGQSVDIIANVSGKEYEKNGEVKYFTNIQVNSIRVFNPTIEQDAYRRANEQVPRHNPSDRIQAQYADAYTGSTIITGETDLPF